MMTFHNFAGYEFIFAFKQPDVTYVTSSFFEKRLRDPRIRSCVVQSIWLH